MRALHPNWTLAAILLGTALAAMVAAGAVSSAVEPTRSATAVVALAPNGTSGSTPDTVRLLRGGYADLIGADEEIRAVAAQLGLDGDALDDVDVLVPDGANTIEVTVTHTQPSVATAGADALASRLVDVAGRQPLLDAEQIVAADDPARPAGVPPPVTILAAGIFGGLLAFGALLALRAVDPPVRDLATLRALGLRPLASLPGGGDRHLDGPLMLAALAPVTARIEVHDVVALVGVGIDTRGLDHLAGFLAGEGEPGAEVVPVTRPAHPAGQQQWAEADAIVLVVGRTATQREVTAVRDLAAAVRRDVSAVVAIGLAGALEPVDAGASPRPDASAVEQRRGEDG